MRFEFIKTHFFTIYNFYLTLMPPKKKGIKEPDVVVPAGDPKIGKGIFDELCATCHGLEVR